jgi:hypothetical protein
MTPKAETFTQTILNLQGAVVLTQFEAFSLNGMTGAVLASTIQQNTNQWLYQEFSVITRKGGIS